MDITIKLTDREVDSIIVRAPLACQHWTQPIKRQHYIDAIEFLAPGGDEEDPAPGDRLLLSWRAVQIGVARFLTAGGHIPKGDIEWGDLTMVDQIVQHALLGKVVW